MLNTAKLTLLALWAAAAFGQLPPMANETIAMIYPPTAQAEKDTSMLLKLIASLQTVSFNTTDSSFTMRGPANLLGLSEWLLHAIDKPAGWQASARDNGDLVSRQYILTQGGFPIDDKRPVTRIHYFINSDHRDIIETLTVLRTVADVQLTFACENPAVIAVRGDASMVDLADWIIGKLDVPANGDAFADQRQNFAAGVLRLPKKADGSEDFVQTIYLDPSASQQSLLNLVKTIRSQLNIGPRIFQKTSPPTIMVRGNAAVLSQVQQIVASRKP
ncbi:MAG TPA: hypothetical protein VHY84_24335 [Bryobacteraceae bacterium]|jgi:hypothetical protein|nr:hypothetical protein [Bryobacteraceae bacterium]